MTAKNLSPLRIAFLSLTLLFSPAFSYADSLPVLTANAGAPVENKQEDIAKLRDQIYANIVHSQGPDAEKEKIKNINMALEMEAGILPSAQEMSGQSPAAEETKKSQDQTLKYGSRKTGMDDWASGKDKQKKSAYDRTGKSELSVIGSALSPKSPDIATSSYQGLSVAYNINNWLAAGLSAGWTQTEFSNVNDGQGNSFAGGDMVMIPLFADFILHVPVNPYFRPYGVAGLGSVITYTTSGQLNSDQLKSKSVDGLAEKLGGGLDWYITKNLVLFVESDYIFNGSRVRILTAQDEVLVDEKGSDFWYAGGGVKFLFD